jgi:hypothetical protein
MKGLEPTYLDAIESSFSRPRGSALDSMRIGEFRRIFWDCGVVCNAKAGTERDGEEMMVVV